MSNSATKAEMEPPPLTPPGKASHGDLAWPLRRVRFAPRLIILLVGKPPREQEAEGARRIILVCCGPSAHCGPPAPPPFAPRGSPPPPPLAFFVRFSSSLNDPDHLQTADLESVPFVVTCGVISAVVVVAVAVADSAVFWHFRWPGGRWRPLLGLFEHAEPRWCY